MTRLNQAVADYQLALQFNQLAWQQAQAADAKATEELLAAWRRVSRPSSADKRTWWLATRAMLQEFLVALASGTQEPS